MNMKDPLPYKPTHPGEVLKDELDVRGIKQKHLAVSIGVKQSYLSEVINGKRPVTADLSILLEKALDIPAEFWMRFQIQFEIDSARQKEKNIIRLRNIKRIKQKSSA